MKAKKLAVDGLLECSKCRESKPVEMFHRHCKMASGYRSQCKECLGHDKPVGRPPKMPVSGMDTCTQCGETKPVSEFGPEKAKRSGLRSTCRACDSARSKRYMGRTAESYIKHVLCSSHKSRKKSKRRKAWGHGCVTPEFICGLFMDQCGLCAVTGIPMTHETGGTSTDRESNISIDRIDSDLGYEIGNVQLVCKAVNTIKHNHTMDRLDFWCRAILNRQQ